MSLPLAAAVDRAFAQRLPQLAALLNRCPSASGLFERITVPSEAATDLAPNVEPLETAEIGEVLEPDTGAVGVEGGVAGPALMVPGTNVLTGLAVGALREVMSPELLALEQRGGGLVSTLSHVALFGLGALIARSAPCQGISQVLNGVLQHVPFLRGENYFAQSVQLLVGSQVGQMIGRHLRQADPPAATAGTAAAEAPADGVTGPRIGFVAQECVVCNDALRGKVTVLFNCGHACICEDCSGLWESRSDRACPVCRQANVSEWMTLVI